MGQIMATPLVRGTIVKLISGGPRMVIHDRLKSEFTGQEVYSCQWFVDGHLFCDLFALPLVIPVTDLEAVPSMTPRRA